MLSERMIRITSICFVACDYDSGGAAEYLAAAGRQYHWPAKSNAALRSLAEDTFLRVDLSTLLSWVNFEEPADVSACREALRFAREYVVARARLARYTVVCFLENHNVAARATLRRCGARTHMACSVGYAAVAVKKGYQLPRYQLRNWPQWSAALG